MAELVIATNPDPDSRLPYVIRVPYGNGLVFRAGDTWPRTKAVFCYPIDEWPEGAEVVERVGARSCVRRGASIDLVPDPGSGEPLTDRLHQSSRPRRGVLAERGQCRPRHPSRTRRSGHGRDNGVEVSDRGRIAKPMVDAFWAANPGR